MAKQVSNAIQLGDATDPAKNVVVRVDEATGIVYIERGSLASTVPTGPEGRTELARFDASGNLLAKRHIVIARVNVAQSISAGVVTKLNFQTIVEDPNSWFSTTTGRFIPSIAGWYRVGGKVGIAPTNNRLGLLYSKNGVTTELMDCVSAYRVSGSELTYLNGTTDYIELMGYAGVATNTEPTKTLFQAELVSAD